jgi:hypothetical protein
VDISYSKGWFRAKKRPLEPWDEARARKAHDQREPYAATANAGGAPKIFLEFSGDYVGVGFLDPRLREDLSYQFQERKPSQLFLTMATYRVFDGDTDRVERGTTYVFQEDGRVSIVEEDFGKGSRSTKETHSDVSGNWEPYPAFGSYEGLIKRERANSRS